MKISFRLVRASLIVITGFVTSIIHAQHNSPAELANALLKKMTLEEKVGQMAQVTLDVIGDKKGLPFHTDAEKVKDVILNYKLGSILNTAENTAMTIEAWDALVQDLQMVTQQTRLKIPLIYGFDAIHGATYVSTATLFPQQIGQAATWNRQLIFDAATITAYESRASSVPWNFSPVLDLGTNPLWPRFWETYGEDPYLVSQMGIQAVRGYQGEIGSKEHMIACLKHYMAYSDPRTGKDRTDAWIPEHYLREYHLPSFAAAVKAGVRTVMVNSALINGIPTHINKHVLTDILKVELGFSGFVVTDWQDIENVYKRDKIAKDNKEAVMLAINAGIDMAMIPYEYKEFCSDLLALVKEKKVSMARIDDAVRRILTVKYEIGLFETPFTDRTAYPEYASAAHERASYNTAAESITLLKNQNEILPISGKERILVTGPNANSMRPLNGGWSYSWQGERTDEFAGRYHTILEALNERMPKGNVQFAPGVAYKMKGKYFEDSLVDLDAVKAMAANADQIVLCIGENSYTETPGNLHDLGLSNNQAKLAELVLSLGKPVIVLLNEGRPRIINKIEPGAAAILQLYLPGNFGGDAVADILLGKVNPSGKLPYTYPRYPNGLTNYIHKGSDNIANPQGQYDYSADFNPQYEFGYGLSYTRYTYSDLLIKKNKLGVNDNVEISVKVKNTGSRDGKEIVQVFISDLIASISPDVKRLRGFDKIALKAGEEKLVNFSIPVKDLAFVNLQNKKQIEKGDFKLQVAGLTANFEVTDGITW